MEKLLLIRSFKQKRPLHNARMYVIRKASHMMESAGFVKP